MTYHLRGFVAGVVAGVVGVAGFGIGRMTTPDRYPVRIPCPPVVAEDDQCVTVPLWAVDSSEVAR